jgi:acyl-CoA thioesterase-1
VDGLYDTGNDWNNLTNGQVSFTPTPANPMWASINVGSGPSKLLILISSSSNNAYLGTDAGSPGDYLIQTSPDGSSGSWKTVASVKANPLRAREHSFDFTGQSWVRIAVTGAAADAKGVVKIDEIDVHDASAGMQDTWVFLGDSISNMSFPKAPYVNPSFADNINAAKPSYYPVMINGATSGTSSSDPLVADTRCVIANPCTVMDLWLELNPDVRFWVIGYGTNDSWSTAPAGYDPLIFVNMFKANMDKLVNKVLAAGRVPLLRQIPYTTLFPASHADVVPYNTAQDQLTAQYGLAAGPDLYTYFKNNTNQMYDGMHPTNQGAVGINLLWSQSVLPLYTH